jgi:adenine-specific DNA-methyltransferase
VLIESEKIYVSATKPHHRQHFGQFFTPPSVARFMCRWLIEQGAACLFDPAFGLGAFFFAAQELDSKITFLGIEKDSKILAHFRNIFPNHDELGLSIKHADYLADWGNGHSAIVCNPPYMRFQKFSDRKELIPRLEQQLGHSVSGYINIASAFLLKSLKELRIGGSLAYIMPLEFLNAGYGESVKQALLGRGLKAILRIEPEAEVFPDAITSVGILLVSDDGIRDSVLFCNVRSMDQLNGGLNELSGRKVSIENLQSQKKWLQFFEEPVHFCSESLQPLRHYGSFSRGIATGANEFFLLSRSEANRLRLPSSILVPCISRSSQVTQSVITDEFVHELIEKDERVLLVDLCASKDQSVRRYIEEGESRGFDTRYLTRMRRPWYRLEKRRPAPILFGVFSRNGFKPVRNRSRALSLTCFHGFQPNLFGTNFVDHLFLYFCSPIGQRILSKESRRYGDKLDKFEPHDLNNVLVPKPERFAKISSDRIRQAMENIARQGAELATQGLFDDLTDHDPGLIHAISSADR